MIRQGGMQDFSLIRRIERRVFGRFAYMDNEILEMIEKSIILLYDEKGYISFFYQDDSCHIESIAVLPGEKGKGIGTTLMRSMEEMCRKYGKRSVVLEVREKNQRAIKFYENLGYRKMGIIENYYMMSYRGSRNAYIMEKILRPEPCD